VTDSLASATTRLEQIAPGYLARIRASAAERALPADPHAHARRVLQLIEEMSTVNVSPPAPSAGGWKRLVRMLTHPSAVARRGSVRLVKSFAGRVLRWYVAQVTGQVAELSNSLWLLGRSLLDYTEHLESEITALRAEVETLRQPASD
jgi:hypothetical protein